MRPASILALTLLAGGIASATVIFDTGNVPQTDSNVLFNCSTVCQDGPGTVIGHLQQVVPDTAVDFNSLEGLQVIGPGFNAVSGMNPTTGFDDMQITVPGHTFTSIILQLTSLASAPNGSVIFTAHLSGEADQTSTAFFDGHTGGNYFTILATSGEKMTGLDFTSNVFQDNVSQVRIGGVSGATVVPEPISLSLVGGGLLALGLFRKRFSA